MADIAIILGHPNNDSYCAALAEAYVEGAQRAGKSCELICISDLQFDPSLHKGYDGVEFQPLEPDLRRVQKAIEQAAHVVWVFPMWWVGLPAMTKGLIDRAFLPGWAFKYEGNAMPKKLLTGRSARVVMTMDSPRWWYVLGYGRGPHHSFVRGTLRFSGFGPIRRTVLHSVSRMTSDQRKRWRAKVGELGQLDASKLA